MGHVEVVRVLMEGGADINAASKDLQVIYAETGQGVRDVNAADKDGWTPMYSAAFNGQKFVKDYKIICTTQNRNNKGRKIHAK